MTVQTVTVGTTLEVIGPTSVRYDDKVYTDVTLIDFGGGVTKTPEAILTDAGGVTYSASELKACIKIEGTDANANNKQMFTLYSQNSHQTGKNETGAVPGGMWLEMFNFSGDASTNSVLGMWQKYFTSVGTDYKTQYDPAWLGFRMNYGTIARHSYVLTYIDDFNQESVPCPPSVINATFMQRAGFYGVFRPTPPEQNGNLYLPISDFRLYRSDVTADGQYVYRLCRYVTLSSVMPHENISPFPRGVYSYSATPWTQQFGYIIRDFTGPDEMTSTVLPSVDWDPPPPRSLKGLVAGWNGIMFAYAGNTLYPFEPYRPHTAPAIYRISFPFEITALAVDTNMLVVLTTGPAYGVFGAHPSALTNEALPNSIASRPADYSPSLDTSPPARAVVSTPIGVVYASEEGLMLISGGRSTLLTEKLYTKTDWQEKWGGLLSKMRLSYSNGKVMAYFAGQSTNGFMLHLDGSGLIEWGATDVRNTHAFPGSKGLYILSGTGQQSALSNFESPESTGELASTWKSKRFVLPKPSNFGCFQIVGSGSVKVTVLAGGVSIFSSTFTLSGSGTISRLPPGFKDRTWEVQLEPAAGARVSEFYLADTVLELQNV